MNDPSQFFRWHRVTPALAGLALLLSSCSRSPESPGAESGSESKPNAEHNVVILDQSAQEQIGLTIEILQKTELRPEVKGYGQVIDPSVLAVQVADYMTTKAANETSRAELQRLRILAAQNNASDRALQTAVAVAQRDAALLEVAQMKLLANWGAHFAGRSDLPAFVQTLAKGEAFLVRVDLPANETVEGTPAGARFVNLAGEEIKAEAEVLGRLPFVSPQTQGPGFLFSIRAAGGGAAPGAAVTAYLQFPGGTEPGVVVPRSAILRHGGEAWVFVETNGTNFTRNLVTLDRPLNDGWFVTNGVSPGDRVVVTAAQTLFSEELKAGGFTSGERE